MVNDIFNYIAYIQILNKSDKKSMKYNQCMNNKHITIWQMNKFANVKNWVTAKVILPGKTVKGNKNPVPDMQTINIDGK